MFVDPGRPVGAAITRLTGITDADVAGASTADVAAAAFAAFAGSAPLVGHNVGFDVSFLERAGLAPGAARLDTADLASIVMPTAPSYALQRLAADAGIDPGSAHRALDDALTCASVLGDLFERARAIDPLMLSEAAALGSLLGSPAAEFFALALRGAFTVTRGATVRVDVADRPGGPSATSAIDRVATVFSAGGPLAMGLPSYESRPQQLEMAGAIEETMATGGVLVVEAGTGVGKTLAYLVPALARAAAGERVIVSTHALPLQDQIVRKDLPALQAALGTSVSVALLKGRGNYLCPRRWQIFRGALTTREEARLYLKTLLWRATTETGDRAEINLLGGENELWPRISADDESCTSRRCGTTRGGCYLERARQHAASSGVVVANHALLLHDARAGNTILPEADHVVVDEAHRLEDVAADAFGHKLEDWRLRRDLERIARSPLVIASLRADAERVAIAEALRAEVARAHEMGADAFAALAEVVGPEDRVRVTGGLRADEGRWLPVELSAERLADACAGVRGAADRLATIAPLDEGDAVEELSSATKELIGTLSAIRHGIHAPQRAEIVWIERADRSLGLYVAPAHVGAMLRDALVERHRSVIFTSATLAVAGSLAFAAERFGVADIADELEVGSPFDYASQAVLLVPSEGALPHDHGYAEECATAITDIGLALGGRTLVLFTSHTAMREVSGRLEELESANVAVLTQGIDGSRRALLDRFAQGRAVLLGTQSFWEGVDLPGELLSCVIVTRLPFDVPADPLVQGRSERYDDPFREYQLPQAALRLRQGVGRLIRTATDRGAIVLLDRRIVLKDYGPTLLASLPPARVHRVPPETLGTAVAAWCAR
ncbi:MAG: hypothetical protein HY071_06870 [Chloroflexi bacterium]|nr:hypothetical protein [Chloroflexota bacterium]